MSLGSGGSSGSSKGGGTRVTTPTSTYPVTFDPDPGAKPGQITRPAPRPKGPVKTNTDTSRTPRVTTGDSAPVRKHTPTITGQMR